MKALTCNTTRKKTEVSGVTVPAYCEFVEIIGIPR